MRMISCQSRFAVDGSAAHAKSRFAMDVIERPMEKVKIIGPRVPGYEKVLTPEALEFVVGLQHRFNPERQRLLAKREVRQERLDAGERPTFLPETKEIRKRDWTVAELPKDLLDRRVEITGPVDRKMIINALNSGASVYMADFEDSTTPSWAN